MGDALVCVCGHTWLHHEPGLEGRCRTCSCLEFHSSNLDDIKCGTFKDTPPETTCVCGHYAISHDHPHGMDRCNRCDCKEFRYPEVKCANCNFSIREHNKHKSNVCRHFSLKNEGSGWCVVCKKPVTPVETVVSVGDNTSIDGRTGQFRHRTCSLGAPSVTKRFAVIRHLDETGVSGTGHIADGIIFHDGAVALRWRTKTPGTTFFATMEDAKAVHGHDSKTQFLELDSAEQVWMCCRCLAQADDMSTYCMECGGGNCPIPLADYAMESIQQHDKQRLESLREKDKELRALRRLAFEMFGPIELGLRMSRHMDGTVFGVTRDGSASDYLERNAEIVPLDPNRVRELTVPHKGTWR